MKRIDELGISRTPWTARLFESDGDKIGYVATGDGGSAGLSCDVRAVADNVLMAAAPDMFEACREVCDLCASGEERDGKSADMGGDCARCPIGMALNKAIGIGVDGADNFTNNADKGECR